MNIVTKILDSLKSYGYVPSIVYLILRSIEKTPDDMSRRRQISLIWNGYVPRDFQNYNLDDYVIDDYLSLLEKERMAFEISPTDAEKLDDKRLFFSTLETTNTEFQIPEVYGVDQLDEVLQSSDVIAKPQGGKCGVGVRVIRSSLDLGSDLFGDDILFMEKIEPPEWMPTYRDGLGTLRLFMLDGEVTGAMVRIPTIDSYPVDNWSSGGIAAGVDLQSGKINQVLVRDRDGNIIETSYHPNTGESIKGVEVPNFQKAIDEVELLFEYFPTARVIGWDVIPFDDKIVLLEANRNPNMKVTQLFRPLRSL